MRSRLARLTLFLLPLLLLAFDIAQARVGGGHSYSGGGHGGGGGGYSGGHSYSGGSGGYSSGGGDIGLIYWVFRLVFNILEGLVWLTFHKPWFGIPLDLFLGYAFWKVFGIGRQIEYQINGEGSGENEDQRGLFMRNARISAATHRLEQLRKQLDPNFSQILLVDFLHALYSAVQHARGSRKLGSFMGYLSSDAIASLEKLSPSLRAIQGVVVGSAAIVDVSAIQADQVTEIRVEFEANYTEVSVTGASQSWYARESWKLTRKPGVHSREPAKIRQIACPACGAPPATNGQGVCPACGTQIRSGQYDWYVESVGVEREQRPPLLTSTVEEEGTDLPTLVDPDFAMQNAAYLGAHGEFKWEAFSSRASFIFLQLQKAWTERKWETVRPFESDSIFETHSYWMGEYKKQNLVNVIQNVKIQKLMPVKITEDRFYSAITVRIYASMIDFTRDAGGKTVSGSSSRPREFSEYWTFIRGRSAVAPKVGASDLNCPACGAGLKINMSGHCEYCQAKVTSGDFDWVLSSIEQDEAYAG